MIAAEQEGEEVAATSKLCKMGSENEPAKVPALRGCWSSLDVGGIAVTDLLLFENDRFAGAQMTLKSQDFDKMKAIFIDKYGPPAKSENREVSNRIGAKFTDTKLAWYGETVVVRLERFGRDLTKARGSIMLKDYAQRRVDAAAAKIKKARDAF